MPLTPRLPSRENLQRTLNGETPCRFVALGIGYEFNDRISAIAGYRALGVDYDDDGFLFDTVQQGPIFGLAVKF